MMQMKKNKPHHLNEEKARKLRGARHTGQKNAVQFCKNLV